MLRVQAQIKEGKEKQKGYLPLVPILMRASLVSGCCSTATEALVVTLRGEAFKLMLLGIHNTRPEQHPLLNNIV